MNKVRVLVNKYSHAGSGVTRVYSEHDSKRAAKLQAARLRKTADYHIICIEEASNDKA